MILAHHTTIYALKSIMKDKKIYPVFDCVWMTTNIAGETTAGMSMENKHKARIIIEIPVNKILKFHDIHKEFPHLSLIFLNAITDTSLWYISDEPIDEQYFKSVDIMTDEGKWIKYNEK